MTRSAVIEWVWRRDAIARARATSIAPEQRVCLDRAHAAASLGDTAFDGLEVTPNLPASSLSIGLHGQAAYWALRSAVPSGASTDPGTLFANAPAELVERAAGGRSAWEALCKLFSGSFVEHAEADESRQLEDALVAKRFVAAFLELIDLRFQTVGSLLVERVLRVGLVLISLLLVAFGVRVATRPENYAAGRTWRASSGHSDWPAQGKLDHWRKPFFHTNEENGPWLEIDLQQPREIGALKIDNRGDCCIERAVPLIVETSRDGKSWEEVARRGTPFEHWTAQFPPRTASLVRLRVPRTTSLHLDDVQVLPSR